MDRLPALLIRVAQVTAGLVAAIGFLVLVGWALDVSVLRKALLGLAPMRPNAAIGFVLAGVSLWLIPPGRVKPRYLWFARAGAAVVAAIGLLTLSEYLFGWDAGIDGLLCRQCPILAALPYAGRMPPVTAINLLMMGSALILSTLHRRAAHRLAQGLALMTGSVTALVLVGYAADVHALVQFSLTAHVALPAVFAFLMLAGATLCILTDVGIMALLTSDSVGGLLARRLLPIAVVAPILLAWMERTGERFGLYPSDLGEAMFTIITILVFVILIGRSAVEVSRKDDQRRQAEGALRKSEQWLRAISDNATGVIWVKDLDGRFLIANRYLEEVMGIPLERIIGHTVFDIFPPREAQQYTHNDRQVLDSDQTVEFEETMMLRDGVHSYVATKFPLRDASGRVYALGAICTDITQRKQAESALRASENQLRLITDALPSLITYVDADRRYRFTNRAYEVWFGLTQGDLYGKHLEQVLGTDAYRNIVQHIDAVLGGQPVSYETTMPYQYGGPREVRSTCVPDFGPDGRVNGYFAMVNDITDSKRAEAALRASEAQLAEAMEIAQLVYWEYDVIEDVFTFNDSFYALYHTTAEREGGYIVSSAHYAQRFVHPDDAPLIGIEIGKVLASTGVEYQSQVDHRILCGDGEIRHVTVHILVMARDEQGRVVKTRGVNQDITERKQTEAQIAQLNAELEQRVADRTAQLVAANQEMEAFTYSVSHDLRAPLRAIDGFSRILVEDYTGRLDAEGHRLLGVVRTNAQRMDRLITDLLALSRVTRSALAATRLDMTEQANSVYQEIVQSDAQPEAQPGLSISIAPLHEAHGDPTLIRQVWANLLSNAIKYTRTKPDRQIEVSSYVQDGMNVYYVKDNGVGFDPTYSHKLFGVFQRLHRVSDFEGTGVGLAIVQRIIHRHGGQVWAEGQVNEGATFYFSLPAAGDHDLSHQASIAGTSVAGSEAR